MSDERERMPLPFFRRDDLDNARLFAVFLDALDKCFKVFEFIPSRCKYRDSASIFLQM